MVCRDTKSVYIGSQVSYMKYRNRVVPFDEELISILLYATCQVDIQKHITT